MLLLLCEVYYLLMILVCFYLKIDYSTRFSIIKLSKKKCDSKQDFKDEDFEPLCVIIKTIDFLEGYNMIYFDNSATTIPYAEALRTYQEVASKIFGNPSSLHNLGTKASRILEASRKQIADLLGVKSNEILFHAYPAALKSPSISNDADAPKLPNASPAVLNTAVMPYPHVTHLLTVAIHQNAADG